MKIAIITSVHEPLDIRIFYKEATTLAKAGYQVTLIAPFDINAIETINNHNITSIPLYSSKKRLERPKVWLQIMHHLRSLSADVWHFQDPELLPIAVLLKNLVKKNIKLIYDVHEDVPKDILDKPWIPFFLRKPVSILFDGIERLGMKRCDLILAATDSIALRAKASCVNVYTIHNYPIANTLNKTSTKDQKSNPFRVLYAGTIIETRGIREIVLAMDELMGIPVELHLLGEFYPTGFEEEIRRIAGKNVFFAGKIPFEKMPDYLQTCNIGIVCFHPLPNHIEAMPNKLFEYMQAGLAVIASDFPLWRKIIEDSNSGILVNPEDSHEIANAIRQLIENPDLCKAMGQAGMKATNEKYSWQKESELLITAYSHLL